MWIKKRSRDPDESETYWQAPTPKPPRDFECRQCGGSGFIPVCVIDKRHVAQIVSATCECQAGRHEEECRARATTNGEGKQVATHFTLEQARYRDLVPPHPTSHTVYWLHAKLCEARHDMIRCGDEDDSRVRYLEDAAKTHEVPVVDDAVANGAGA